jgi:hypothetical protein
MYAYPDSGPTLSDGGSVLLADPDLKTEGGEGMTRHVGTADTMEGSGLLESARETDVLGRLDVLLSASSIAWPRLQTHEDKITW